MTALNLPALGLGLLRAGDLTRGIAWLLAPSLAVAALILAATLLPPPDVDAFLAFGGVAIVASIASLIVVSFQTWRRSAVVAPLRWWNRWYGLLACYLVSGALVMLTVDAMHRIYKTFYAPSASMVPNILVDDNFLVDMRDRSPPRRGEIVVFDAPQGQWIKRVIAIGGDRIAIRGGVPVINGRRAAQRQTGRQTVEMDRPMVATVFEESLPGAAAPYAVLDVGPMMFDDMPEVTVPPGYFYVIGDYRDNSLDSRHPVDQGGLGMIPDARIVGRPMFLYWRDGGIVRGGRINR
ncbi:signal peptidase I [Glacieibacterium frigidum]|uniref:signal peptidase I n=1 Tax=Glacieibacterium frigidum TaxID=2593303 RepID=UPI00163D7114|nr:signal peptidase I [Glacieibacterium frigidum]